MIEIFLFALNAIAPILLLIFLGYFLRSMNMYDDNFLKTANSLVFRILLPTLLFYNIYGIESLESLDFRSVGYAVLIVMMLFLLGLATVVFFVKNPAQKGVILQCTFRSNFAIIGMPMAEALGGRSALAIVAILSAISIPLFNVLAVISLSLFTNEEGTKINWLNILKKIIKNPLIIGCGVGILALIIRGFIPVNQEGTHIFTISNNLPFLYDAIGNLAKIASPLALIVLGGQFSFNTVSKMLPMVILGTLWRIAIAPVLGLTIAIVLTKYTNILSFNSGHFSAFLALFGSPAAVSSAIMAGEMGSDEELAGQLVVWTSIGSIFTIFIQVVLLRLIDIL